MKSSMRGWVMDAAMSVENGRGCEYAIPGLNFPLFICTFPSRIRLEKVTDEPGRAKPITSETQKYQLH